MMQVLQQIEEQVSNEATLIDERFEKAYVCPHCDNTGKGVIKNGHSRKGSQTFLCKKCKRTFTIRTKTVFAHTHKNASVWKKFIRCMIQKLTVREAAAACGISKTTAFVWRHKILDALQKMMESVILGGEIEADETFFPLSYKGNHKKSKRFTMPRKSRKRGSENHKPGMSHEHVCVPCAVNKAGLSIARATNTSKPKKAIISQLYKNHIETGSTLVTDSARVYLHLTKLIGIKHIRVAKDKHLNGKHGIQRINSYHSQLKHFIHHFRGVSTKYLNNYLVWHNFANISKEHQASKEQTLFSFLLKTQNLTRGYSLSQRPSTPFA